MARKKRKTPNETPVRSVRVPDKFWGNWDVAAKIAGIDRTKFIVTVVNHAAETLMREHKIELEREEENKGVR